MKKYKQWVAKYDLMSDYDMESFIKMRILVAHTGINHNGSEFSHESFEAAKHTIANKPLLARVIEVGDGEYDFNGHDMDWEIDEDGNFKVTYLEMPIGVIPETNDYDIVEYDNREYVAVTGYVWRGYSNLAEQIMDKRGEVEVSMEIDFNDEDTHYDENKGVFAINKFRYKGVTLLGAHVQPGMEKAHATAVYTRKSDEEITTEYTRMIDKLKEELETMFSSQDQEGGEPEMNKFEEMFKLIFGVETLDGFDKDAIKVMQVSEFETMSTEIEQYKAQIEQLNTALTELKEFKAEHEKAEAEAQRQAILDDYAELLEEAEITEISEANESNEQLEFALAKAYVEKTKPLFAREKGVHTQNTNMFARNKEGASKKRVIAL